MIYDSIIVGGGPAGITAGIYLARANKKVAIIEKMAFGGQVAEIGLIENYPGFFNITGSDLAMNMYKQAKDLGVQFILDEVQAYELDSQIKKIKTRSKQYEAKTVILAIGSQPRKLNIENEKEFVGRGVSYCPTCDGNFFKGKNVAVVGSGDSAISNAQYLSNIAKKVYIISKYEPMKLKNTSLDEIENITNIQIISPAQTKAIIGSDKVEGLEYEKDGKLIKVEIEGVFVSVGRNPDTESLSAILTLDEKGYIITDQNSQTSVQGVFAAGDVVSGGLKQIISAASSGAEASTSVLNYLSKTK